MSTCRKVCDKLHNSLILQLVKSSKECHRSSTAPQIRLISTSSNKHIAFCKTTTTNIRPVANHFSTTAPSNSRVRKRPVVGLPPKENKRLTEVITIYEKLTKSRDRDNEDIFRLSISENFRDFKSSAEKKSPSETDESATILDFSKFQNIKNQNYMYFSAKSGLIQANSLKSLKATTPTKDTTTPSDDQDYLSLLNCKQFCLCIVNPTENDLSFLGSRLHVHDLTLRDIREQNTEEKVEVFKHYTFISFKVYLEHADSGMDSYSHRGRKEDLNIVMFPGSESAIILHYGVPWTGFKDMFGFLNLLSTYGDSSVTPDWILFSVIIEMAQDAKYSVKQLEPKILNLKLTTPDSLPNNLGKGDAHTFHADLDASADLSSVLTKNFENEFEIYKINRFIKPKINVLKELKVKGASRFSPKVLNLLTGTRKEFEELGEDLGHFNHILERSQDTCLTLANVRQSKEANEMGSMMKRISEVALLFLPLQAVAGLLGMNVRIPMQDWPSTAPFWGIIATSSALVIVVYRFSKSASAKKSLPIKVSTKAKGSESK